MTVPELQKYTLVFPIEVFDIVFSTGSWLSTAMESMLIDILFKVNNI